MKRTLATTSALLTALALVPTAASAQVPCVIKNLRNRVVLVSGAPLQNFGASGFIRVTLELKSDHLSEFLLKTQSRVVAGNQPILQPVQTRRGASSITVLIQPRGGSFAYQVIFKPLSDVRAVELAFTQTVVYPSGLTQRQDLILKARQRSFADLELRSPKAENTVLGQGGQHRSFTINPCLEGIQTIVRIELPNKKSVSKATGTTHRLKLPNPSSGTREQAIVRLIGISNKTGERFELDRKTFFIDPKP